MAMGVRHYAKGSEDFDPSVAAVWCLRGRAN